MENQLPQNLQAELALISNIFTKNDIMADCIGVLSPNDFYNKANEIIYTKMTSLYKKNVPIDVITFANSIDKNLLQGIGGMTYLTKIIASEATTSNYKSYINIIRDLSIKRNLIATCRNALNSAYKDNVHAKEIIDTLGSNLVISNGLDTQKTVNTQELMESTINMIEQGFKDGGKIRGVPTGFKKIDEAINGMMQGDLIIIAARPSMGKTAVVMNILNNLPTGTNGAIFEMEMSEEKLGVRMLAPKALLNSMDLGKGRVKEGDFKTIMYKADEIANKNNVFINCKAGLSVSEIRAEAKKIKIQHGLKVVFIDHIGLVRPNDLKGTRNDQIGQISKDLKAMAKDLEVCVIALSQLSRACESRPDKHPMMNDLRDSGNIEQDADAILMLYRDDYYAERENRESATPNIMDILIAKSRDGEAGIVKLFYNTKYQLITDQYHGSFC